MQENRRDAQRPGFLVSLLRSSLILAALDRFTVRWRDPRGKAHLIEAECTNRRVDGEDYEGEGI